MQSNQQQLYSSIPITHEIPYHGLIGIDTLGRNITGRGPQLPPIIASTSNGSEQDYSTHFSLRLSGSELAGFGYCTLPMPHSPKRSDGNTDLPNQYNPQFQQHHYSMLPVNQETPYHRRIGMNTLGNITSSESYWPQLPPTSLADGRQHFGEPGTSPGPLVPRNFVENSQNYVPHHPMPHCPSRSGIGSETASGYNTLRMQSNQLFQQHRYSMLPVTHEMSYHGRIGVDALGRNITSSGSQWLRLPPPSLAYGGQQFGESITSVALNHGDLSSYVPRKYIEKEPPNCAPNHAMPNSQSCGSVPVSGYSALTMQSNQQFQQHYNERHGMLPPRLPLTITQHGRHDHHYNNVHAHRNITSPGSNWPSLLPTLPSDGYPHRR